MGMALLIETIQRFHALAFLHSNLSCLHDGVHGDNLARLRSDVSHFFIFFLQRHCIAMEGVHDTRRFHMLHFGFRKSADIMTWRSTDGWKYPNCM
jgi:hypothetical protein